MLKFKHSQCNSHLEMAKLHIALGEMDEAKKEMALAKASMVEIALLKEVAMQLDAAEKNWKMRLLKNAGWRKKMGKSMNNTISNSMCFTMCATLQIC